MSEGIVKLPWTFNVKPLAEALKDTQWWNCIPLRTRDPQSVHRHVSDIWLRHGALDDPMTLTDTPGYKFIWYDMPDLMPTVKVLINEMFIRTKGTEIGTCLITKLPPGKQVYDHIDSSYNARTFSKYAIAIEADQAQSFKVGDKELRVDTGASWWFDNSIIHSVHNDSDHNRISLIISILTPRGIHVS